MWALNEPKSWFQRTITACFEISIMGLLAHSIMVQQKKSKAGQSTRAWVAGLAVTLTTIVAYMAFWHIWPIATFVIGCTALAGLLVAGWWLGAETTRSQEKSPPLPSDRDS